MLEETYDPTVPPENYGDHDEPLPCGCSLEYGPDAKVCDHTCHDSWRVFFGVAA